MHDTQVKTKKLTPYLLPKAKYVCHVRNLQLYAQSGVKIAAVHRGVTFREEAFLKPYIHTELRTAATNAVDKDLFKLLNYSVFGKSWEDLFKRIDLKLVRERSEALKLIAKPQYKHHHIFPDDLVAVNSHVKTVKLDKLSYLGTAIHIVPFEDVYYGLY